MQDPLSLARFTDSHRYYSPIRASKLVVPLTWLFPMSRKCHGPVLTPLTLTLMSEKGSCFMSTNP